MKKKIIQLSVVAVLLCGMIAALVVLQRQPVPEESSSSVADDKIYLLGGEGEKPAATVVIENESGRFTVKNLSPGEDTPEYTITGREGLPLDSYTLGAACKGAAAFWARELIAESPTPEQLKEYGLDNLRATFTATQATGGTAQSVEIGGPSPGGDGAYVRIAGSEAVYLCAKTVTDPFLLPETAYVAKRLVGGSAQESQFKRLALSGGDYPEPIVIAETPETTIEAGGMQLGTHGIVAPFVAEADFQNGLQPLTALFGLTASGAAAIGDDAATLAQYGLDEPDMIVEMSTDAEDVGNVKLLFARADDGAVYVYKDGVAAVFTVDAASLPWMGLSAFDLRSKMVLLPSIDSVATVEVLTQDGGYAFSLAGEGNDLAVTGPGGNTLDTKNFRQFYQTMISARYTEETDSAPAEDTQPLVQYTYTYRNGAKPDVVQFFAGPPRRVYVRLNDGPFYLEQSVYADRVLADVKLVAEDQPVESYF